MRGCAKAVGERLLDGRGRERRARGTPRRAPSASPSRRALRRRRVDRLEPRDRVGLVARQLDEHERDAVAAAPLSSAPRTSAGTITFSGAAPRRGAGEARAARPRRRRARRRWGVTPKRRRSGAQVVERARHAHVAAPRRAGAVERRAGRGRQQRVRRACARAAAATPAQAAPAARSASRSGASASAAPSAARSATRAGEAARRATARAPAPTRPPSGRGSAVDAGPRVEQQLAELGDRDAVDHAVVRLADHRELAVGQPVGDPELPQRAVARQRRRRRCASTIASRSPPGGVQDVLGGIEVRVVDPHRLVHARAAPGAASGGSAARARGRPARCSNSSAKPGRGAVLRRVEAWTTQPTCIGAASALDREEGGVEGGRGARRSRPPAAAPVVVGQLRGLGRRAELAEHGGEAVRVVLAAACGRRPRSGRAGCRASPRGRRRRGRRG